MLDETGLSVHTSPSVSVDEGSLIVHWELFTFLQKLHLVSTDKVE